MVAGITPALVVVEICFRIIFVLGMWVPILSIAYNSESINPLDILIQLPNPSLQLLPSFLRERFAAEGAEANVCPLPT